MPSSTIAIATLLFCKAYENTECGQCKVTIPPKELVVIFRQSMGKEISNTYLHLECIPPYGNQLLEGTEKIEQPLTEDLLSVGT